MKELKDSLLVIIEVVILFLLVYLFFCISAIRQDVKFMRERFTDASYCKNINSTIPSNTTIIKI